MNEEEIKLREYLIILNEEHPTHKKENANFSIINLFEKQQKEIKARLKEIDSLYKMMSVKDEELENLYDFSSHRENRIDGLINKIKEKIEEITSYAYTRAEERDCQDYAIQVLKEILGE